MLSLPGAVPQASRNYHPDCEAWVNVQIQLQLYASYVYLSMAVYCERFNVALKDFSRFFLHQSDWWREGAEKFMWMQNKRGGHVILRDIVEPDCTDWQGSMQCVENAIYLENILKRSLQVLQNMAASKDDCELRDFVQRNFLIPQVTIFIKLEECLKNLSEMGFQREGLENCFHWLNLDDDDGGGSHEEN
ncbi:Ferritin heavy chain [Fukomys damarensis]|uniref:Ferritin n=2 Tax=Fukomys damarensis TaxID=885580 RepID=A0A091CVC4_FUKDA|nr:Ferritin heavy chain [Fukomys damarensis]